MCVDGEKALRHKQNKILFRPTSKMDKGCCCPFRFLTCLYLVPQRCTLCDLSCHVIIDSPKICIVQRTLVSTLAENRTPLGRKKPDWHSEKVYWTEPIQRPKAMDVSSTKNPCSHRVALGCRKISLPFHLNPLYKHTALPAVILTNCNNRSPSSIDQDNLGRHW